MRKNIAGQFIYFEMINKTTGDPVTTGTPVVDITIGNGTPIIGSGAKVHKIAGQWSYAPSQAETNGNDIAFTMSLTNAVNQTLTVFTVAFDPTDAAGLGLTNLDVTISSRNAIPPNTVIPLAAASTATAANQTTLLGRIIGTLASGTHNPATAAQIAVLSDWINGGRLDLLLDAIPTTPMRGTDSVPTNPALDSDYTPARALLLDNLDALISSRNAIAPNTVVPLDSASTATLANQTTILNRIGAFTGSGVNNILGFFRSLLRSDIVTDPTDIGGTFDSTTESVQALRDRGDLSWVTGGGGGITDMLNITPLIPPSIDLADTVSIRLGLMLTNALDDLPSTAEITPGTISIERKAIGGTAWIAVVTNTPCLELAGLIYFDEVFDSASGYAEGDSLRVTFKSQSITVSANVYEITDAIGRFFYTEMRQTARGTDLAATQTSLDSKISANLSFTGSDVNVTLDGERVTLAAATHTGAVIPTVLALTGHTPQGQDHTSGITATLANQTTILNRIGAFTGTGVNNILGFFRSLLRSDIATDPTDIGGTFDSTTDSIQSIRDRGDVGWITGGAGGISDILNVVPLLPGSIDLANTATVRLGLMLVNSLDDLPSTAEITPGTISIDHKAIGGTSWLSVVTDAACLESAGLIYFDEVFDAASGYSEGDSIRITFKSQKITVSANDYEITDAIGRIFYTEVRQTTGAGVADWTAAEKSDIRGSLGVIGTKTTGTGGQIQALPTFQQIWTTALTESYAANGAAPTPAQFLHMLYSVAAQEKMIGNKLETQKLDGVTKSMEFTLDDPNNATSRTRTL